MSRVVTTILLDNNPQGLRLIEVGNWSGKAFVVPRTMLREFKGREDANRPGVYFLFGEGDEKPSVYIGQSGNVAERLTSHDAARQKEEWNEAFVFISDSAYIKYLESRAVYFAMQAKRYKIFNGNTPGRNDISEAQKIIATEYFENIKFIIELFGYPVFIAPKKQKDTQGVYEFSVNKASALGTLLENQEFVVFEGSLARVKETPSFKGSGPARRRRLIDEKVLKQIDDFVYQFTRDYIFSSPSAAADTVAGRSCNGWTAWKDEKGKTLDENIRK